MHDMRIVCIQIESDRKKNDFNCCSDEIFSAYGHIHFIKDMRIRLLVVGLFLVLSVVVAQQVTVNEEPAQAKSADQIPGLFEVWPEVDQYLKEQYWFYIRGAETLHEAAIDSPERYLYFTIYRNIVGTFMATSTWNKQTGKILVDTFVRLGNGYAPNSGQLYDPVNIEPFIVNMALEPDEYMVTIDDDGSINVTGNEKRFNPESGLRIQADGSITRNTDGTLSSTVDGSGSVESSGAEEEFDLIADMEEKCGRADDFNREKYWYYLDKAELISHNFVPTNTQYFCEFTYVNLVGTFLAISFWNLENKNTGINTLVRLGDGKAEGALYGPVQLTPNVLTLQAIREE